MPPAASSDATANRRAAKKPLSELRGAARASAAKAAQSSKPSSKTSPKARSSRAALPPEPPMAQLRLDLPRLGQLGERPFRSELLVDQASVFVSNNYQGESFTREHRDRDPKTGGTVVRKLAVGILDDGARPRGVLREIHQSLYFKLLELWQREGHPVGRIRGKQFGVIRTSRYELVKMAFGGNDNMRSYKRARELLRDLQAIPIVLRNDYPDGRVDREEFTLLDSVTWSEKLVDESGSSTEGKSTVSVMLSSMVTEGFLANRYRVLLGRSYDALGSRSAGRRPEHARLLLPFLELHLMHREEYAAPLAELAVHFGFTQYSARSKRKEKWSPALKTLNGVAIVEGRYTLRVELIEQREDYVLKARRVVRAQ